MSWEVIYEQQNQLAVQGLCLRRQVRPQNGLLPVAMLVQGVLGGAEEKIGMNKAEESRHRRRLESEWTESG